MYNKIIIMVTIIVSRVDPHLIVYIVYLPRAHEQGVKQLVLSVYLSSSQKSPDLEF